MKHSLKKITRAGIGALVFALVLGLALVQPAKADDKVDQKDFRDDCNADGAVSVPAGTSLEVFNEDMVQDQITVNCTVTLGSDSELNLAEGTDLLFRAGPGPGAGAYKNFTIITGGSGSEMKSRSRRTVGSWPIVS